MHAKLTLLLTNSMQTKQQIVGNENLKKISLPQLTTTANDVFVVRHHHNNIKLPVHCPFPSHSQSIPLSILTGC